jgi:hypothetical protein
VTVPAAPAAPIRPAPHVFTTPIVRELPQPSKMGQ